MFWRWGKYDDEFDRIFLKASSDCKGVVASLPLFNWRFRNQKEAHFIIKQLNGEEKDFMIKHYMAQFGPYQNDAGEPDIDVVDDGSRKVRCVFCCVGAWRFFSIMCPLVVVWELLSGIHGISLVNLFKTIIYFVFGT